MADGPTASDTLGVIGVELWRLHEGRESAFNMIFAVVQTDWKWMAWYWFIDAGLNDNFLSVWADKRGTHAADIYGRGFGRTHHEFRRVFLHLTKAMRVDGLAEDDQAPALMFARNFLGKKDHVYVDIEIQRPSGILTLRRLHMEGNIQKEFDAKSTRGQVLRMAPAEIFDKRKLANPPGGSHL